MGKRIIYILFYILFGNACFGQKDSNLVNHSVYYSCITFDDYSVHSMLGYQMNFGRNQIYIGFSVDRKRTLSLRSPYYTFYSIDSGHETLLYFHRGGEKGIGINNLVIGYNYLWGNYSRLKIYPLANINFYNYKFEGVFDGQIEYGVFGLDPYKIRESAFGLNLGFSFKFDLTSKISLIQDFNLGHYFIYNSYNSQYFGFTENVYHYWVAGGSFRATYKFGK